MAAFPVFTNAVVSQYPSYSETDLFYTLQSDLECGITTTKSMNPGARQRQWTVTFVQMSHEEMDLLEGFFRTMGGTVMPFSFTDDGGTVWPNCKFVSPKLTLHYTEQGAWGGSTEIRSFFVPAAG